MSGAPDCKLAVEISYFGMEEAPASRMVVVAAASCLARKKSNTLARRVKEKEDINAVVKKSTLILHKGGCQGSAVPAQFGAHLVLAAEDAEFSGRALTIPGSQA